MRRGDWAVAPEVLWAASNEGVIAVRELELLGVPEATAYRRCRHGGPWQRLGPGIVALHNGAPTWRQLLIAGLLHGGPDALITGRAALRLHGLRHGPAPEKVHLLIPHPRQVRSWRTFHVERTSRMPWAVERGGLPVAPLTRALLDEARLMTDPTAIAGLLAEPVQRWLVTPAALLEELDAGCRKGSAAPRAVLRAVAAGVRSAAEFDARSWWLAQSELPPARFNVRVRDLSGRTVGVVDALVEDVGLAWEIDSVEHHFATPDQVEATARRQRALRGVGLHVVSTRPSQRRDDEDGVLRDVLDGLAVAAALPAPRATYADDIARAS
ncbi:hypothetical protein [Actinomycetospora straminea]|uniref:Transcriptional regulator, AbiEi antitoxin, Type IV TA system n=1 Tax=Actinomycetospora straminea TaxID=663607 RepID=A0ABP9ETY7_9PSEU|nr:hypothetical protein [Actinomycetospora straminea]MDD7934924.1 hypothetical protein [Actinomycetospora straminea]